MRQLIQILLLSSLVYACKSDAEKAATKVMPEQLDGAWEVIEATRNNRPALSLENARFTIGKDSFATNFLPDTSAYPYSYDGHILRVMDPQKNSFKVSRVNKDTLIFTTVIKNFEFKFVTIPSAYDE